MKSLRPGSDFYAFHVFADPATGVLKTTGSVRLRVFHVVSGPVSGFPYEIYDWSASGGPVFVTESPAAAYDDCVYKPFNVGSPVIDTGIWESSVVLDIDQFVEGDTYVFQFEDVEEGDFLSVELECQYTNEDVMDSIGGDLSVNAFLNATVPSTADFSKVVGCLLAARVGAVGKRSLSGDANKLYLFDHDGTTIGYLALGGSTHGPYNVCGPFTDQRS